MRNGTFFLYHHAFDHEWAWHLAERGLEAMRESGSPYYQILVDHLGRVSRAVKVR